jgi:hypothetical protein
MTPWKGSWDEPHDAAGRDRSPHVQQRNQPGGPLPQMAGADKQSRAGVTATVLCPNEESP